MKKRRTKKMAISLLIFAAGCCLLMTGLKWRIEPNLDVICALKAKGMVLEIINETIEEELSGDADGDSLFMVKTGDDGSVQLVQANTARINRMVSIFAQKIQKRYNDLSPEEVAIPYGTLMGSKLLSQTGATLNVDILPMSVSKYDYETEFESQGINQTRYRVYLCLESTIRVLQPFSASDIDVASKVLLAEVIIVGDVPDSYVNVPKDDILDAT